MGGEEKELLYITSPGHGRLLSHFYVMARGNLQCYHRQGLEPGLRVGDEQALDVVAHTGTRR